MRWIHSLNYKLLNLFKESTYSNVTQMKRIKNKKIEEDSSKKARQK